MLVLNFPPSRSVEVTTALGLGPCMPAWASGIDEWMSASAKLPDCFERLEIGLVGLSDF
jgi:hypothetical protein